MPPPEKASLGSLHHEPDIDDPADATAQIKSESAAAAADDDDQPRRGGKKRGEKKHDDQPRRGRKKRGERSRSPSTVAES